MQTLLDPGQWNQWLQGVLVGWGIPAGLATFIRLAIEATAILIFALTMVLGLIWLERKVAARIQGRLGATVRGRTASCRRWPTP